MPGGLALSLRKSHPGARVARPYRSNWPTSNGTGQRSACASVTVLAAGSK